MKNIFSRTVMLVVVFALVVGGQAFARGEPEATDDDEIHVGLIVKNLVNPFFVYMLYGGEAAANKHGVQFTGTAPEGGEDAEEQLRIIEDLIQRGVDALVIVPIDSRGIVVGLNRAEAAGVPVFISNTRAHGGEFVSFAGIDHVAMAEAMGRYVVDKLGGQGNIIELEGVTGAQSSIDRGIGFKNIFDNEPGITVLERTTADFNRARAMSVTEDLLTRYDNIDAIVAYNDSMALGAIEALRAAGRLADVIVTGTDANQDALKSLEDGELTATVDSDPVAQTFVPVEAAIKYVRDGIVPPDEIIVGEGRPTIVDQDNVRQFQIDLRNRLAEFGVTID